MREKNYRTLDGNEAVARVAFKLNEVIAIYPITPSSAMGEWADEWATAGERNLWDTVPSVVEMQSEGGAAGAVHGALQAGSLTTTFTASQGLLLMIPNMYKIAGELTATAFHVAARAIAAQGLSIFGDHSDVMAARATGWALLSSGSVQEAHDFACIATAATLRARVPFIHFFDGFRTSHEVNKIDLLTDDDLHTMIDADLVNQHRLRRLSPDDPVLRGTAQNPDVYFQARETVNPYYEACPDIVQQEMDRFAALTARRYQLYEYEGAPDATRVIVIMGSGAGAVQETVEYLNARGEKTGVLRVRLYRPFDVARFAAALPESVQRIAVLDRCKEPGSAGEPLYLDVVTALHEARRSGIGVVGGRYGLASKEFTPAMVLAVFRNLAQDAPKNHFTIGINDDLSGTSLDFDPAFSLEPETVTRALFYGLGSDGTVGANKNSIKIIGEETDHYVQGYFVYDSKKSGSMTISHLRISEHPIQSTYLINRASFIACHHFGFIERFDVLAEAVPGGVFLLNTPYAPDEVWEHLPRMAQEHLIAKCLKFYVINGSRVARESGMGGYINTVMQVCFFAISGVLPRDEALTAIRHSIEKTYRKKGEAIVAMNLAAVDRTLENLFEVAVPEAVTSTLPLLPPIADGANGSAFVHNVLGGMLARQGDLIPVGQLPADGTYPTGTAQYEKRNLAEEIPVWDENLCIQCGKCAFVCPHAVIRIKAYAPEALAAAPETFKSTAARDTNWHDLRYSIQVAPEDCTGCGICADICPARDKSATSHKALMMQPQPPLRAQEKTNWDFFLTLPELDRRRIKTTSIRQQQVQQPLFEFSGACAGCGETPYLKLISQLFGDRALIANATGCSSIYGGNHPTTPWAKNHEGRGPAWSNSLFEDNAEFGFGMRVALDKQIEYAAELLRRFAPEVGEELARSILDSRQESEAEIYAQRERVATLKEHLHANPTPGAQTLYTLADALVKKDVWIVGGDGWAYDIGFGGLDHVLASGRNVKLLVLDTEVYSNTGGQASKSTPRGAVAKFAAGGKPGQKKDLGLLAMSYGNVYIARVAMGAKDEHTLRAFIEAEAYPGPALIIAYSHCIAHGINMTTAMKNQKAAVDSGQWLLYRYDPQRGAHGENPLVLDSPAPKIPVRTYMEMENRFKSLSFTRPEAARELAALAQADVEARWAFYAYLAGRKGGQS